MSSLPRVPWTLPSLTYYRILLLKISLLSLFASRFSLLIILNSTQSRNNCHLENKNEIEGHSFQAMTWFPSSPLKENFKDLSILPSSTSDFCGSFPWSPLKVLLLSTATTFALSNMMVNYQSSSSFSQHSYPGFTFSWLSPTFLDSLLVLSLKVKEL